MSLLIYLVGKITRCRDRNRERIVQDKQKIEILILPK